MTRPTRPPPDRADREELERFKREINLTEFAAARGYRIDRRESSRNSVVMRHSSTDDKIVVARREADQHWTYFSVRDPRDNGTIVDFVQRRDRSTLGEARKELRKWSGHQRGAVSVDQYVSTLASPTRDRAAVQKLYGAARAARNSVYLNTRGIRPETLTSPRFLDTFRLDARGNVLFPHRDDEGICGFESKNYDWTSFASGGVKALWMSRIEPTDTRLVLVESAVDALSHYQLRGETRSRYASTAGALRRDGQLDLVRRAVEALPPGGTISLAFDADDAGDKLAAVVESVARGATIERERTSGGKDWNDALKQRELVYIEACLRQRSAGLDRGGR